MKKIIIEIDDQTYKAVQLHPGCFNFAHAILNGKPLQTEYEEIKAEIIKLDYDNCPSLPYPEYVIEDVICILDNRIKELGARINLCDSCTHKKWDCDDTEAYDCSQYDKELNDEEDKTDN